MGNGFCFVCGEKNDSGLKLEFAIDRTRRQASCQTIVTDQYCGWSGFVHGGVLASIIDGAMVHACKSIDLACMTAELNIKYKKPVPLNTKISICATVKDLRMVLTYTVVYTEAIIHIEGKIAARAKAKMFVQKNLQ
jgi:uncharacterized protein (TIGR00369 family)